MVYFSKKSEKNMTVMAQNNFPEMIIIGGAKCGTTSTHHYLRQHPQISLPLRKETHFFIADQNGIDPVHEYMGKIYHNAITDQGDYFAEFSDPNSSSIRVEVCPSYIFVPNAAANIHRLDPASIIVALLRDPVERFFSDHKFITMNGGLDPTSRQFSPDRFNADVVSLSEGKAPIAIQSIFERGKYANGLDRYRGFFSRNSIKIHLFEELQTDPKRLMNTLISYIGLDPFPFDTKQKFMVSGSLQNEGLYKRVKNTNFAKRLMRVLPVSVYQKFRGQFESAVIQKIVDIPEPGRAILRELYKNEMIRLRDEWDLKIDHWIKP